MKHVDQCLDGEAVQNVLGFLKEGAYVVIPIFRLLQNKCQENTMRSKVVGRSCENLMRTQSEIKATPLDNFDPLSDRLGFGSN